VAYHYNSEIYAPDRLVPEGLPRLDKPGDPIAYSMTLCVGGYRYVRAYLVCGESYTIHPIDIVEFGLVKPLSRTQGLRPSRYPVFKWEIATRRLLTVPMANNDFVEWARNHAR